MISLATAHARLKATHSDDAASLCALIDNNKVEGYRSGVRQRFGTSEIDRPQLGSRFAFLSSEKIRYIKDVKDSFLREIQETPDFGDRDTYFASNTSGENADKISQRDDRSHIIESLQTMDTALEAFDDVIAFQSEAMDSTRHDISWEPETTLHTSMTKCVILPSNTMLHLQHNNEGTTTTTLLSGSIVWVIWPPTDHNLRTLQDAYEDFAIDKDKNRLDVTQSLEHGLLLMQSKGEGLRVPPFCPMVSFATTISAIAMSTTVTEENFISSLQKAPLLKAHFNIEPDGALKQTELIASALDWLERLLNSKLDEETESRDTTYRLQLVDGGPLHTLLSTWNDVKEGLAAMMSITEQETIKDIWSTFLVNQGRLCKLCGKPVSKKLDMMREHFEAEHWVKVAPRVDSAEAAS